MKKIIGSFYFRQTESKNLIGEYTNNSLDIILTECSNFCITNQVEERFIGNYTTVWHEKIDGAQTLNLEISFKPKSNQNIFFLNWTTLDGKKQFEGFGFIVDGLLIGSYTST